MPARAGVSRAGAVSPGIVSDKLIPNVFSVHAGDVEDSSVAGGRSGSSVSGDATSLLGVSTLWASLSGWAYRWFQYSGQSRRKNYTGSEQSLEQSIRMSAVRNGLSAVESGVIRDRKRICRLVGVEQARQRLQHDIDDLTSRSDDARGCRYDVDDGPAERVPGLADPVLRTGQRLGAARPEPFDADSGLDNQRRQSPVGTNNKPLATAVQFQRPSGTETGLSGGRDRLLTEHEQTIRARHTATENTVTHSDATGDSQPEQAYRGENQ